MTDYTTAIFGLITFTGIVSAAVVYILAQPSDLPVVKKAKAAENWDLFRNILYGEYHEHTRPSCSSCELRASLFCSEYLQSEQTATVYNFTCRYESVTK